MIKTFLALKKEYWEEYANNNPFYCQNLFS